MVWKNNKFVSFILLNWINELSSNEIIYLKNCADNKLKAINCWNEILLIQYFLVSHQIRALSVFNWCHCILYISLDLVLEFSRSLLWSWQCHKLFMLFWLLRSILYKDISFSVFNHWLERVSILTTTFYK